MVDSNYKYNELKYAELIYRKGFQTKHLPTELRLLVLYFKEVLNLKPKERHVKLYEFCEAHLPNFKRARYYKIINKALQSANKKGQKLIVVDKIDVYKDEFDYINNLDVEHNFKKVLFTFLIQMKLNKNIYEYKNEKPYVSKFFKGGSIKYNNIKKMANLPTKINICADVIHFLAQEGLIATYHNGLICLNFLDNCSPSGDILFELRDYENVGWCFDWLTQQPKIKLCALCGQPFKQTKSEIMYCAKHKGYQPIEYKEIRCIDCDKDVSVDSKDNETCRCSECRIKHLKLVRREQNKRYYNNKMKI